MIAERLGPLMDGARPRRRRRLHRQPGRARPRRAALRPRAAQGARHAAASSPPARSTSGPKEISSGADVRRAAVGADPRRRPHDAPADARREPARLERLADDRARHARPAARAAGARREARRRRPAPQPHGRGGRRAPRDPARAPTRSCCSRSSTCCSPRGSPRPGGWPSWPTASSGRGARAAVHARGGGARATGIEADDDPPHGARAGRRASRAAVYGRIGTTTQEFGTLASWLVDVLNVLTGNLDRPGGAMFPRAAAGQRNSSGEPGRGRGVQTRPLALARARAAGVARRAAGRGAGRGDRDARARAGCAR